MKLREFGLGFVAVGVLSLSVFAQTDPDVKDVGMGRRATYLQTGASTVTFQHYDFSVGVGIRQPGGVINGVQVFGPGSSVIGNGVTATGYSSGFEYQSGTYASLGAFNTAFPVAGSYVVNIDTSIAGTPPDYVVEYLWPTNATSTFPTTMPVLTSLGGYWSGGSLYLDVTQNQSFTWSYGDYGLGSPTDVDGITLEIELSMSGNVFDYSSIGSNSTGTTMTTAQHTMVVGQTYNAKLSFGRIVDDGLNNPNSSPQSGIVGAESIAYYLNSTSFTIVAIPEPSTYALMAVGLGLVALPWLRRRFSRR
ncbi:PEP-CTERM sorting domain-containing protein [Oleiharenicola lentus]|uniref:PEP-CTERM sorting domain-containing protein n=1 Tax=Oleiharenicola lentus TaxID=2508720 RepID=UPI003F67DC08